MPVVLYDHILQPKWHDWAGSLALKYSPVRLKGAWDPDYNYSKLDQLKIITKRSFYKVGLGSTTWTPPPTKSTKREIGSFIRQFDRLARSPSLTLSKDSVFDEASSRLMEKLEQLKADFS
jgi:succinoglycan biosynthesis protein ExoV